MSRMNMRWVGRELDPTNDGDDSYDREVSVEEGEKPVKGDMIIEKEDD